jgi:hypothetical protein
MGLSSIPVLLVLIPIPTSHCSKSFFLLILLTGPLIYKRARMAAAPPNIIGIAVAAAPAFLAAAGVAVVFAVPFVAPVAEAVPLAAAPVPEVVLEAGGEPLAPAAEVVGETLALVFGATEVLLDDFDTLPWAAARPMKARTASENFIVRYWRGTGEAITC